MDNIEAANKQEWERLIDENGRLVAKSLELEKLAQQRQSEIDQLRDVIRDFLDRVDETLPAG